MKNPKPSVLMVTYQYAPAADGGAARQAQLLAEHLAARGRRIGVVTARYAGSPRSERVAGVEVNRVWAIPKPGRFSATFLPSLARFLAHHGPSYDVWHAHQAFYNAGVALGLSRLFRRLCIVKAAASGPYGDLARLRRVPMGSWVRRALLGANAVISLNSEMTQELLTAGIKSARIQEIPNGVDCERFSPASLAQRRAARSVLGIPPDGALALFAGRLAENKGTSFLLDAWRSVERQSPERLWTLILAGEESRVGEFSGRGEYELRPPRFLGKVLDVRGLLHAADLLVHPSLTEGLSNVVLEAMATGLPVVGTAIGGLREQVEHGVTGLLVPARDADALAQAMTTLLRDGELRAKMGAAGRISVEQRFGIASVVDAYEELYDQLVREGVGGVPALPSP